MLSNYFAQCDQTLRGLIEQKYFGLFGLSAVVAREKAHLHLIAYARS